MKATLVYTLPEEADEFWIAQNGWKYRAVLGELDERMRVAVKHGSTTDCPAGMSLEAWQYAADAFRQLLHILMDEENVSLY